MNFFDFADSHPIVTVLLALIAASVPASIIRAFRPRKIITINTKSKDQCDKN